MRKNDDKLVETLNSSQTKPIQYNYVVFTNTLLNLKLYVCAGLRIEKKKKLSMNVSATANVRTVTSHRCIYNALVQLECCGK